MGTQGLHNSRSEYWFEVCTLNNDQKKDLKRLSGETDFDFHCFSLFLPRRGDKLLNALFICKVCDVHKMLKFYSYKSHKLKPDHLQNILNNVGSKGKDTMVSKINNESVFYIDFNNEAQKFSCTLCNTLLDKYDDCELHCQSTQHLEKLKSLKMNKSSEETCKKPFDLSSSLKIDGHSNHKVDLKLETLEENLSVPTTETTSSDNKLNQASTSTEAFSNKSDTSNIKANDTLVLLKTYFKSFKKNNEANAWQNNSFLENIPCKKSENEADQPACWHKGNTLQEKINVATLLWQRDEDFWQERIFILDFYSKLLDGQKFDWEKYWFYIYIKRKEMYCAACQISFSIYQANRLFYHFVSNEHRKKCDVYGPFADFYENLKFFYFNMHVGGYCFFCDIFDPNLDVNNTDSLWRHILSTPHFESLLTKFEKIKTDNLQLMQSFKSIDPNYGFQVDTVFSAKKIKLTVQFFLYRNIYAQISLDPKIKQFLDFYNQLDISRKILWRNYWFFMVIEEHEKSRTYCKACKYYVPGSIFNDSKPLFDHFMDKQHEEICGVFGNFLSFATNSTFVKDYDSRMTFCSLCRVLEKCIVSRSTTVWNHILSVKHCKLLEQEFVKKFKENDFKVSSLQKSQNLKYSHLSQEGQEKKGSNESLNKQLTKLKGSHPENDLKFKPKNVVTKIATNKVFDSEGKIFYDFYLKISDMDKVFWEEHWFFVKRKKTDNGQTFCAACKIFFLGTFSHRPEIMLGHLKGKKHKANCTKYGSTFEFGENVLLLNFLAVNKAHCSLCNITVSDCSKENVLSLWCHLLSPKHYELLEKIFRKIKDPIKCDSTSRLVKETSLKKNLGKPLAKDFPTVKGNSLDKPDYLQDWLQAKRLYDFHSKLVDDDKTVWEKYWFYGIGKGNKSCQTLCSACEVFFPGAMTYKPDIMLQHLKSRSHRLKCSKYGSFLEFGENVKLLNFLSDNQAFCSLCDINLSYCPLKDVFSLWCHFLSSEHYQLLKQQFKKKKLQPLKQENGKENEHSKISIASVSGAAVIKPKKVDFANHPEEVFSKNIPLNQAFHGKTILKRANEHSSTQDKDELKIKTNCNGSVSKSEQISPIITCKSSDAFSKSIPVSQTVSRKTVPNNKTDSTQENKRTHAVNVNHRLSAYKSDNSSLNANRSSDSTKFIHYKGSRVELGELIFFINGGNKNQSPHEVKLLNHPNRLVYSLEILWDFYSKLSIPNKILWEKNWFYVVMKVIVDLGSAKYESPTIMCSACDNVVSWPDVHSSEKLFEHFKSSNHIDLCHYYGFFAHFSKNVVFLPMDNGDYFCKICDMAVILKNYGEYKFDVNYWIWKHLLSVGHSNNLISIMEEKKSGRPYNKHLQLFRSESDLHFSLYADRCITHVNDLVRLEDEFYIYSANYPIKNLMAKCDYFVCKLCNRCLSSTDDSHFKHVTSTTHVNNLSLALRMLFSPDRTSLSGFGSNISDFVEHCKNSRDIDSFSLHHAGIQPVGILSKNSYCIICDSVIEPDFVPLHCRADKHQERLNYFKKTLRYLLEIKEENYRIEKVMNKTAKIENNLSPSLTNSAVPKYVLTAAAAISGLYFYLRNSV